MTPSDSVTKSWQPVVPVKKSVTPDAVVCLCCGEKFKTLRRHLQTSHQLSPREYRATFGRSGYIQSNTTAGRILHGRIMRHNDLTGRSHSALVVR